MRWISLISAVGMLQLIRSAYGHNWITAVTQSSGVDPFNKKPGTARGAPGPTDPEADTKWVNSIEAADLNVKVCKENRRGFQEDGLKDVYPAFQAAPGDWLYLYWRDNGHITKDKYDSSLNKKKEVDNGKIWVYGSEKIDGLDGNPTLQQLRSGKWADAVELATSPYDDGMCAERNGTITYIERCLKGGGGECKVAVRIPPDVKGEWYTLVWTWDYSGKTSGTIAHWYTSCVDIKIMKGAKPSSPNKPPEIPKLGKEISQADHDNQLAIARNYEQAKITAQNEGKPIPPLPWADKLVCEKKLKPAKRSTIPETTRSAKFRF